MKARASMPLLQTKARPEDVSSVIVGDEVYLHHDEHGPLAGRVVSVGADGCNVDHPEHGRLGVKWEKLLGHKLRVSRKLTVTDRGEDGALALDEDGKVVFVRGQIPEPDAETQAELAGAPLTKALEALAVRPAADYAPLADAIGMLAKAWSAHLAAEAERREAAQIRQEAADVHRDRLVSDLCKAFLEPLQRIADEHRAERGEWLAALSRVPAGAAPSGTSEVAPASGAPGQDPPA